jgi:hypothetical protein
MYKSVIIVDDSEMESQITKRILFTKSFAENVETFSSAMVALIYLNNTSAFPDMIVLDARFMTWTIRIYGCQPGYFPTRHIPLSFALRVQDLPRFAYLR